MFLSSRPRSHFLPRELRHKQDLLKELRLVNSHQLIVCCHVQRLRSFEAAYYTCRLIALHCWGLFGLEMQEFSLRKNCAFKRKH